MSESSPRRNGQHDSPQRQLLSEERRFRSQERRNGSRQRSPDLDSPSRQIVAEFARLVMITERERYEKIEEETAEKRKEHEAAITRARIEHDRIREAAVRLKQQLDFEAEKLRQEEEERSIRAWEQAQRDKEVQTARTAKAREDALKAEKERQRQGEQRAAEEAEQAARREREKLESQERLKKIGEAAKLKIKQEAEERARREAEAKAKTDVPNGVSTPSAVATSRPPPAVTAASSQPAAAQPVPTKPAPSGLPISPVIIPGDARKAEHEKYLAVHQRLKKLRQSMKKQCREAKRENPNSPLAKVDDTRRQLMKKIGQLTNPSSQESKRNNMAVRSQVKEILNAAISFQTPSVDIREYVPSANDPSAAPTQSTQVSAIFVYLLNIVVKQAVAQWIGSATTTTYNAAEPIGVLVAAIIADPNFSWNGHTFASLVLAKFHVACPILFGIFGQENTVQGRVRLGWRKVGDEEYVTAEDHYDRMRGLGAGWASLTLRNFTKSPMQNAFPNWNYWRALACITNVPPSLATPTHFVVLKALLDQGYAKTFIKLYGQAGCVAVRRAVVDFPEQAPKSAQREGVRVLRDKFRDEKILGLEF